MACIGEGPIYILSLCKEGFPWGSAGKRICLQFRTPGFDGSLGWGGLLEKREATHSRGWDGWMASPIWWMWVWVSSGSWWWTGKSGVLQSMGLQRVRQDWATEMNCVSSWAHFMLICLCYVLRLCHFFKSCALPPSLLFRKYNQERIRHMEIC